MLVTERFTQLLKSNSVLRQPETPSPHEINIYITKLPHVSPCSVSLCLNERGHFDAVTDFD
jgi:hypothetical protein